MKLFRRRGFTLCNMYKIYNKSEVDPAFNWLPTHVQHKSQKNTCNLKKKTFCLIMESIENPLLLVYSVFCKTLLDSYIETNIKSFPQKKQLKIIIARYNQSENNMTEVTIVTSAIKRGMHTFADAWAICCSRGITSSMSFECQSTCDTSPAWCASRAVSLRPASNISLAWNSTNNSYTHVLTRILTIKYKSKAEYIIYKINTKYLKH